MLKPDLLYSRITELTPEALRKLGVRALLLDVDNTLALHGKPEPPSRNAGLGGTDD